ncbi:inositol phosphorylceramide glucuronosyltransferase 1 [Mercurialis annua]|uniref:inositol phosphorylceramide glucuronosyltransferase 1 n=1 Tax=Mercurialis annua TaxID=3986 RepID=UPI00215F9934|nr:inositol phosphorylceramide glucuronosyltransferase 1 [Mercurialis annua]
METIRGPQLTMSDGHNIATEVVTDEEAHLCLYVLLQDMLKVGDMVVGFEMEWGFKGCSSRSNSGRYTTEHTSHSDRSEHHHVARKVEHHIALLTLCTKLGCILIRLSPNYISPSLKRFFAIKDIVFVGVHIKEDVQKLRDSYGVVLRNAVELSDWAAKIQDHPRFIFYSARELANKILSTKFEPKPYTVLWSNWFDHNLSPEQIECAASDAYAAYKIGKKLMDSGSKRLFSPQWIITSYFLMPRNPSKIITEESNTTTPYSSSDDLKSEKEKENSNPKPCQNIKNQNQNKKKSKDSNFIVFFLNFLGKIGTIFSRKSSHLLSEMKLSKFGAIYILIALISIQLGDSLRSQKTNQAYVTLLYGDEFLLGVRVLGKSIRDTGSKKDTVVLVSDGVSDYAIKLLDADGWIVEKISLLANPNQKRPKRFWGVYTKLKIFQMTNYSKVVFLDADTIVVKSIEDLFKCRKFCANLKHSERFNSGVMVVEPSLSLFNDMMSKVNSLHSYTGGDQGFLNSYYSDFPNAHVFQPDLPQDILDSRPAPAMERLSTLYNADVGLYMLANKWMVNETELRVIHYTLGPLKPWDWYTSWLLKPVDVWQNVREQLEDSLPGTGGGKNPDVELLVKFLFLLPFCAVLFFNYRSCIQTRVFCRNTLFDHIRHLYYTIRTNGYAGVSASSTFSPTKLFSNGAQSKVPVYLGGLSVCVCFMAALVSAAFSLAIVPRQVTPWTGLLLMYEWTFTIFFLLFGGFLRLTHLWGKITANQVLLSAHPESSDHESEKGHQRQGSSCDDATWYYGLGMAFLAIATPSLPCIFGITALFARLGLVVAGGIVLASFMTYASEHLAIRAFLKGFEDRDMTRTRSLCV